MCFFGAIVISLYWWITSDWYAEYVEIGCTFIIGSFFVIKLFHFLLSSPIRSNKEWITLNGIFSSKKGSSEKINANKLEPFEGALAEINRLKEKGLLSDEESKQARSNLINKKFSK